MTELYVEEIPEYWLGTASVLGVGQESHRTLLEMYYDLLLIIKANFHADICEKPSEIDLRVKKLRTDLTSNTYVENPLEFGGYAGNNIWCDASCLKFPIAGQIEPSYIDLVSATAAESPFFLFYEPSKQSRTVALWFGQHEAETLTSEDIAGMPSTVKILCIALDFSNSKKNTNQLVDLLESLAKFGFTPLARDMTSEDSSSNIIFINNVFGHTEDVARLLNFYTRGGKRTKTRAVVKGPKVSSNSTPVIVPCFNNSTHCESMLQQLISFGFEKITYVDNSSTSEEMLEWLEETSRSGIRVEKLKTNLGPKESVFTPERLRTLPRWFCVTDPDLIFNEYLPADFLSVMTEALLKYKVPKAGFALDISSFHSLRTDKFLIGNQSFTIREWESQFWKRRLGYTPLGDAVYKAEVDTTFAIYDRNTLNLTDFLSAIRISGKFTALHSPWLLDNKVNDDELNYYKRNQKFSFYCSI